MGPSSEMPAGTTCSRPQPIWLRTLSSICARLDAAGVAEGAELLQMASGDNDTILAQEGHNGSVGQNAGGHGMLWWCPRRGRQGTPSLSKNLVGAVLMCILLLSLLSEIVASPPLDVGAAARAPFHGAASIVDLVASDTGEEER
jgi:hypothetical protein